MVLSMLSAIQNVKLPNSSSGSSNHHHHQVETKPDMSRRKQRNPKPIFNSTEDDQDHQNESEESQRITADGAAETSETDNDSIHEDLHTMVKVEVHEEKTPPPISVPPPLMPATPTPPPSTSSGLRLPPLRSNPEQMMLNHTAELLAKQNMFFFGDVTVAEHPDAPPVPMVIPMAYLYPLPSTNKENVKYRMFVPLGGGLGPELLAPPPPVAPPIPPSPGIISSNLPKLEKVPVPVSRSSESRDSSSERRKSGSSELTSTTPLDLSKSPEIDLNRSLNSDSESEAILPDQRALPPLRRVSIVKEDELKSTPARPSAASPAGNPHIEAQLQFLKAKQLEFLKGQQQKQAAAFAAAQAAAVAAQQKSRCEECNINFAKHQNYVAHKKYYCSANAGSSAAAGSSNLQAKNAPAPPLPITSDNDDDKSSDDGKSQRKLSPPIRSPALLMAGLASPKDRKEENGKDDRKSQISPNLLLPSGITTPPLPHFVCEGCGIKFKSVSNLQAHQARYCAGLRKASEDAFEALMKQKQHQQQQQQQQKALPMLEMMSLLNAKSNSEQDKLSSLMMSSMAAAAMAAASNATNGQNSNSSEDYCCILCGYKEQSVDRLKDHINLHFIGQVKRKHEDSSTEDNKNGNKSTTDESAPKRLKSESESSSSIEAPPKIQSPTSPKEAEIDEEQRQLKCNCCEIGFTHLSNFVAHKKYYCRGGVVKTQSQASPELTKNGSNDDNK